ncbi:hypothetical protein MHM88_04300 [Epibacterium sp. MM17-32]|uniref:hypothetical protein n=1 Tax=Epibacterium sp. MM17-32 TaxID=2917734 RepID=UPI001EF7204F|nr:hypothetical protein [Epibacterium sp. MM17-32]MCG7627013.1 hypothetical protein [Epibacterium sp. MM17-32]
MVNHVAIASVGFAVFIFMVLILLGAEAMRKTHGEGTLLEGQRDIADKYGWGDWERIKQHPHMLMVQVWMLRFATLAAFFFTCWHAASAVNSL